MLPNSSTIAAIASPTGTGAISLIRISGPDALQIAGQAAQVDLAGQKTHTVRYRSIRDAAGGVIDDGLLSVFLAPSSATGEDCVEFSGHGGLLVTRKILSRFMECGAVMAGPGEFSQRAFLNGKMDLTQSEAVMDLISAQTDLSLRAARGHMEGRLTKKTMELRDGLLATLAHLEAWIDFPEEDISTDTISIIRKKIIQIRQETEILLGTADQGRILRSGVLTVIHGPPNVGKSSLLNHLLGYERAIVCETAGTTRDTIEETINFHGIPLRLVDTAGIRDTSDDVEQQGISRAIRQVESADLVLRLNDASQEAPVQGTSGRSGAAKEIAILNKADLAEHSSWHGHPAIRISCQTGAGMEPLRAAIMEALHVNTSQIASESVAINERHESCLKRASSAMENALEVLGEEWNAELAAIDLRESLDALGEIPGKLDTEDLLGEIFSQFCIGK